MALLDVKRNQNAFYLCLFSARLTEPRKVLWKFGSASLLNSLTPTLWGSSSMSVSKLVSWFSICLGNFVFLEKHAVME